MLIPANMPEQALRTSKTRALWKPKCFLSWSDVLGSYETRNPGPSNADVGFEAGLHRTYISLIEKGKSNTSLDNVEKLAHAFGLTVSELLRPPNGALDQDTLCALSGSGTGEK